MSDHFSPRLSDYLDDDLTPGERLEIERHLLDCAACRTELEQLRRVVADAQSLPDVAPDRDLWPDVRAAIPAPARRRFITMSIPQALAAGVFLAVVSALCMVLLLQRQPQAPTGDMAVRTAEAGAVPVRLSDPKYDRAVDDLTRLLDEERANLSPKTIEALEKSLTTIDRAIAEARDALAKDPSDPFLNNHLAQQRRTKIAFLRQVNQLARSGS